LLTQKIARTHFATGRIPIAVYPEVTSGNPFQLPVVARWLLNRPGLLGGDKEYADDEILFCYDPWAVPAGMHAETLHIPSIDTRIFNNIDNEHDRQRSGFCYYANKYLASGGSVAPELIQEGISLGQGIVRSHEEIAAILRKSEYLYCYEQSALIQEALACGCPVIIKTSDYWKKSRWTARFFGAAEDTDPAGLAAIKAEVAQYHDVLQNHQKECWGFFDNFTAITQQAAERFVSAPTAIHDIAQLNERPALAWATAPSERKLLNGVFTRLFGACFPSEDSNGDLAALPPPDFDLNQSTWLASRRLQDGDDNIVAKASEDWHTFPQFHLVIRHFNDGTRLLADTLESLNHQIYGNWRVDIVTTLSPPDSIELPSLAWHNIDSDEHAKTTIDFVIATAGRDWIVELPPGAILDPLCLWRVATHIAQSGNIAAIFTDDDIHDRMGMRQSPRFKPGTNPEWLLSADLAGPLFVQRETWRNSGGAAQQGQSAWFDQLLRVAATAGWAGISHIPDVLISYPGNFPSSPEACLHALQTSASPAAGCEISPVSESAWRIRYPLPPIPSITLAVISRGQLEFLQGCLESLVEHTPWADIELLLVREQTDDTELESWLAGYRFHGASPRQVLLRNGASWAEACNASIISATHEHIVLLQEDTRILDPDWLENLLRTLSAPDVSAVSPRLVRPVTGLIAYAGDILGLTDENASPYQDEARFSDPSYLDCLQVARDVSLLAKGCMLLTRSDYIAVEGMEAEHFPDHLAHHDLSLKLLSAGKRIIYQPQTTLVHYGEALRDHLATSNMAQQEAQIAASRNFAQRWMRKGIADPYWNSNLSLASKHPLSEAAYHPTWQYIPANLPRIAARPVTNGQGDFRIISPLMAARRAGLALDCLWPQSDSREFTAAEIARLGADSLIVQNYLVDIRLNGLAEWRRHRTDTFIVYALDDLCTEMPLASSLRSNVHANARSRLKFALSQCNRLVVSTDFLAEAYRHFIDDIHVVPNRLEERIWGPLQSRRQTGKKPRIGWAGGTTHLGDLSLLRDVIAATRNEADWVFFGMCPDEIRPLISEYHDFGPFATYPAKLAALNLDIAVAPLETNRFNQGKSNLRLLEYGILGIPVVCTDITPYRNSPAKCVPNNAQAWIEALRERIHDPLAAQTEGDALRAWVKRGYILENFHAEWLAAHLP